MSFNSMKVAELRNVAEQFGVELPAGANKAAIIKNLNDEGVTYEMYDAFANAEKVEPEDDVLAVFQSKPEVDQNAILIKMTRANPLFQWNKYAWTSEHPFVLMSEDDAEELMDSEEGFVIAKPSEVQSYYDRA